MKKKKTYRITQRSATRATSNLKLALKKVNWKLFFSVTGLTILFTSVYQVCMHFEIAAVMWIYYIALILLAVMYVITNRGFARKAPTPEELPSDWDDAKKAAHIEKLTEQKKKAKIYLVFIIPLLFSFMFEVIYIFYLEPFIKDIQRYMVIH